MKAPPADWPFVDASRFVSVRPHRWHVQQIGAGPDLLLLHGAGASTHSWRRLAPLLSDRFRVTMIDLPGHGFTQPAHRNRAGLDTMAEDTTRLMRHLDIRPAAIIGHSAGATIALRLAMDAERPIPVVSINGAFQMFDGVAGTLFPLMAKALAFNPLTVPLFTAASTPGRTRRLLEGTGSAVDEEGVALYHQLVSNRQHVAGALAMMASWSLDRLVREAANFDGPVLLLAGSKDTTVPPKVSEQIATRLRHADLRVLSGYGHLIHEEAADPVAETALGFLAEHGVG